MGVAQDKRKHIKLKFQFYLGDFVNGMEDRVICAICGRLLDNLGVLVYNVVFISYWFRADGHSVEYHHVGFTNVFNQYPWTHVFIRNSQFYCTILNQIIIMI